MPQEGLEKTRTRKTRRASKPPPKRKETGSKPQAAPRDPVGADVVKIATTLPRDPTRPTAADRFRAKFPQLGG